MLVLAAPYNLEKTFHHCLQKTTNLHGLQKAPSIVKNSDEISQQHLHKIIQLQQISHFKGTNKFHSKCNI